MNESSAKIAALELLRSALKRSGYSVTAVREHVFDALWNREAQSMRDLQVKTNRQLDKVSLYRTIALFESLGLVHRVNIGWKYKVELSDMFTHHHHHISCLKCGKLLAIKEDDELEAHITSIAEKYGISAERHQLEIQGYCEKCCSTD